jgi:ligand-binding sensor domain-containing protein
MHTSSASRVVLYVLIVAALIGSSVHPIAASTLAQDRSDPRTPDRVADPEVQISGPSVDAALERAPDPDRALIVDQANPQWRTIYGTEAGRQLLRPRRSEVPAAIEGASPPLSGFWITRTIQSGTNGITAIAYAPDGRLFAGLSIGGLRVYGPNASGIYGWTSINASPGGLPSNWVTSLAIFNGDLWVGTSGSGVGVYDLNSGTWSNYTVANSPLPNDTINRLTPVADPNATDYIWISTNGGAAKYTPSRPLPSWNIINTVDGLPSNTVYDVAVDIDGASTTTWFANYGGLTSWDGSAFSNSLGGGTCTFNYVKRVIVDRLDRVWVIPMDIVPERAEAPQVDVAAGVCRRTFNGLLYTWTRYNTTSPGLPNNNVSDLSEDYAGRIWIGMQPSFLQSGGGGAVYDNGTWRMYTVSSSPVMTDNIRSVLAVGEAVWWGHGGLNTFSVHSPNWLRFNNVPAGETPQSIFLEATRTWIGGTSKIAYTDGGAFTSINIPGNTSYVNSFARDGTGALWIGTGGSGVYKYSSGNFTPYTSTSGLPNNGVNALLSDHLGRIWAGTNNGLALRAEAGYWLTFTTSTSPIAGNIVQALARDSSDRLWIGTTNGVSVYDLNGVGNTAWISYTTANGLPANIVTGLTSDATGNMWASTYGGGVASFNPISNTWTTYSSTLPHTQTLDITADPSGRIWSTTLGGLALRQGSTWRSFRVPESALDSHRHHQPDRQLRPGDFIVLARQRHTGHHDHHQRQLLR